MPTTQKYMNLFNSTRNASLSISVVAVLLVSVYLASCGGGSGSTATSTGTSESGQIDASSPVFDLKGFAYCGKQDDILDLKVKTHVAFGLESENRFVYLYAQTGKLKLSADVFGNDPVPSMYKKGYCKVVTADNRSEERRVGKECW